MLISVRNLEVGVVIVWGVGFECVCFWLNCILIGIMNKV